MGFSKRNREFFLTVGGWIHHEFLQGGVLRRNSLKRFSFEGGGCRFYRFSAFQENNFFFGVIMW